MKGIAIVNAKGGVGKTTTGHLLALGAAWNEVQAHFVHTDDREPLKTDYRPYGYYDCRDVEKLVSLSQSAVYQDGLFIVDGGGNRQTFDWSYIDSMDLVIIPITPSAEDIRVSLNYFNELNYDNAYFVINRYPSNANEKRYVDNKYISQLPADRILHYIPEIKMSRILLDDDDSPFETPPTRVNNIARAFYRNVKDALDAQITTE